MSSQTYIVILAAPGMWRHVALWFGTLLYFLCNNRWFRNFWRWRLLIRAPGHLPQFALVGGGIGVLLFDFAMIVTHLPPVADAESRRRRRADVVYAVYKTHSLISIYLSLIEEEIRRR